VYIGEVHVPWSHIVKPSYKKQKKHVTKNVPTVWSRGENQVPSNTKVTVQGNLVTVVAAGDTYYGVKGMADTGQYAWLTVFLPGEREYLRSVRFASYRSNKAVAYFQK
jgi:hypothetical protein